MVWSDSGHGQGLARQNGTDGLGEAVDVLRSLFPDKVLGL